MCSPRSNWQAGAGDVELLVVGAVGVKDVVEKAPPVLGRLEHHRRPRVSEEHGQVAEPRVPGALLGGGRDGAPTIHVLELRPGPGHEAAVDLRPHEEHGLRETRADVGVHELQAVEEAGALLADVEAGDGPQAELGLEDAAAPGEVVVGSHGGEDHEVDLFGGHLRVREGLAGRGHPQVGGGGAGIDEVSGHHPAPLADPGVGRVHDPRQHVVRHPILGDLGPAAHDDGSRHAASLGPRPQASPGVASIGSYGTEL